MDELRQDVRYAVRSILKTPGFTATAVFVLSLGIGANTAMFTLVNAFLFRPVVGQNPGELVGCYSRNTRTGGYRGFSYPNYLDLCAASRTFSQIAAHDVTMVGLTEGESTRRIFADFVTSNYLATFGVRPVLGRDFTSEEEKPGAAAPVVIVSHELWSRAGRDPGFVGKSLRVNGRLLTVVGVAPEEFTGSTAMFGAEIFLPLGLYDALMRGVFADGGRQLGDRRTDGLVLICRPKLGISTPQIQAELDVIGAQMAKAHPAENKEQILSVHALSRTSISTNPQDDGDLATVAILLISVSSAVLLIACLNLANMLLARGTARQKEFAIRLALGSGRGRILRQLFTEGLILSVVGGAAGLLLAWWGIRILVASMAAMFPIRIVYHSGPDARVLAALLAFCVLATVVSGLGPALKLSRPDLVGGLKEHAGEDAGGRRRFFSRRNVLVVAQISLSLTLLVAAGLFIRGALKAARVDPGFSLDNGILIELDPSLVGYDEKRGRDAYRRIEERLRSLPGIEAVSLAQTVPMGMVSMGRQVYRAEDAAAQTGKVVSAQFNAVGSDYFAALGLRLAGGRTFSQSEQDVREGPRVAIVDELLATRLWPKESPLGKRLHFGAASGRPAVLHEVIGVAPPVRENIFDSSPRPHVYVPFGPNYQSNASFHVRLAPAGEAAQTALLQTVRREIREVDERVPVLGFKTLRAHVEDNLELWIVRTAARLFSAFGALALVLAAIGVYGVKAYTVARRTREIGIRMSLGATVGDVLWLVMGEGVRLTAAGVAIGLLLAFGTARLLSSLLYEVSAADPLIFTTAPALLAATALLACYIPARKAARVHPITALRHD